MSIKTSNELGQELLKVFGLQGRPIKKMTLVLEVEEAAILHVEQFVDIQSGSIETVLQNYEINKIGESL